VRKIVKRWADYSRLGDLSAARPAEDGRYAGAGVGAHLQAGADDE